MPRSARIVLPNTPHHIVQRGHNRQNIFVSNKDYSYYLKNLIDFKQVFSCKIYAYCLMTNHVHLIVDPGENPESLSLLMKRVAGRQTQYINKLEKRTGSLWEGRYKSSIISTQEYLLACCRYVELNPLRAGIVVDPGQYQWSSYAAKALAIDDLVVDLHSSYLSLGKNDEERRKRYTEYVLNTVPEQEIKLIREALQRGQLTGSERFRDEIEKKFGFRVSNKKQGRPKKRQKINLSPF